VACRRRAPARARPRPRSTTATARARGVRRAEADSPDPPQALAGGQRDAARAAILRWAHRQRSDPARHREAEALLELASGGPGEDAQRVLAGSERVVADDHLRLPVEVQIPERDLSAGAAELDAPPRVVEQNDRRALAVAHGAHAADRAVLAHDARARDRVGVDAGDTAGAG